MRPVCRVKIHTYEVDRRRPEVPHCAGQNSRNAYTGAPIPGGGLEPRRAPLPLGFSLTRYPFG